MTIRIGLVGLGQIARNRHLPAIAASPDFTLAGLASADAPPPIDGMTVHADHRAMLAACDLDAVATLGEAEALVRLAARQGRVLFATWHSQYNPAVDHARAFLAGKKLATLRVDWNEDFRKYHPDQAWIWHAEGFGVFDMGINALSVLTRLFAHPPFVRAAELRIAANHAAPLSAILHFGTLDAEGPMEMHMDWGIKGPEQREIRLTTQCGHDLALLDSGGRLEIDGAVVLQTTRHEYPMLYTRFADLVRRGQSDIDLAPLKITLDALAIGQRQRIPAFED